MAMTGRKFSAGSGYRFGFNGKENDKEAGESVQDYGMRIYDGRIGKFLSVDPITKEYPELTPYQFASNTPIEAIDLDGLEKLSVITTSFAPFDLFGGDLFGDYVGDGKNRMFGSAPFSFNGDIGKYRTMGGVKFDMSNTSTELSTFSGSTTCTYRRPKWNPFGDYSKRTATRTNLEGDKSSSSNSLTFKFHTAASNGAVVGGDTKLVPDIDNHVSLSVEKIGKTQLKITSQVTGDRYPSNETYLMDEKGNKLILGVAGASAGTSGPYTELFGDKNLLKSNSYFIVEMNADNTFKGVKNGDKLISLSDWNKQFTAQDPKKASGTTASGSGVTTFDYDEN